MNDCLLGADAMRLPVAPLLATLRSKRPIRPAMSRNVSSESVQPGPVEASIRQKLNELFKPTALQISNDSAQHSHHTAMREQGGGNGETHFSVMIVSDAFEQKRSMQRHRMIYSALADEFKAGLHALSINAKAPGEIISQGGADTN